MQDRSLPFRPNLLNALSSILRWRCFGAATVLGLVSISSPALAVPAASVLESENETAAGTTRALGEALGIRFVEGSSSSLIVERNGQEYIVDLVMATRKPQAYGLQLEELIQYGASPRATIYLTLAAKANAFLHGRGHVVPQDIKEMALDVLRHRVILTYEAEAEEKTSDEVIRTILDKLPVP